jgi:hypothetical protein
MNEAEWLVSEDPSAMLEDICEKVSDRKLRLFACSCVRQVWDLLADERSRNAVKVAERFADGLAIDSERDAAWTAAWVAAGDAAWTAAWAAAGAAYWTAARTAVRATARTAARAAVEDAADAAVRAAVSDAVRAAVSDAANAAAMAAALNAANSLQAHLLRDIGGNPFKPVKLPAGRRQCDNCEGVGKLWEFFGPDDNYDSAECYRCAGRGWLEDGPCPWLTPTVISLAHAAYDEREEKSGYLTAVRLAVLADSLEEAGCVGESCSKCGGDGWRFDIPPVLAVDYPLNRKEQCEDCQGQGYLSHPLLAHLRSPGPHVRGCWAVDLLLGKE